MRNQAAQRSGIYPLTSFNSNNNKQEAARILQEKLMKSIKQLHDIN